MWREYPGGLDGIKHVYQRGFRGGSLIDGSSTLLLNQCGQSDFNRITENLRDRKPSCFCNAPHQLRVLQGQPNGMLFFRRRLLTHFLYCVHDDNLLSQKHITNNTTPYKPREIPPNIEAISLSIFHEKSRSGRVATAFLFEGGLGF